MTAAKTARRETKEGAPLHPDLPLSLTTPTLSSFGRLSPPSFFPLSSLHTYLFSHGVDSNDPHLGGLRSSPRPSVCYSFHICLRLSSSPRALSCRLHHMYFYPYLSPRYSTPSPG